MNPDDVKTQTQALRDNLWASVGTVEPDELTSLDDPLFIELPKWPSLKQAFQIVRIANGTTVIASDGLSDPFSPLHPKRLAGSGFGLELYLETTDALPVEPEGWQFDIIFQAALCVAGHGAIRQEIEQHKSVMLGLHDTSLPAAFQTDGKVSVLLNLPSRIIPAAVNLPLGNALLVSVMLLTPAEAADGDTSPQARANLVTKLITTYHEPVSSLTRL